MKKYISIAVSIVLIIGIGYLLVGTDKWVPTKAPVVSSSGKVIESSSSNVTIKDGIQYIAINAKGGYFPRNSVAKAGMPTKLVVKTENTYDCSSSLVVRSVNYQAMLPATGETMVDIPSKASGEKLQASCGMGMYNFQVDFQ